MKMHNCDISKDEFDQVLGILGESISAALSLSAMTFQGGPKLVSADLYQNEKDQDTSRKLMSWPGLSSREEGAVSNCLEKLIFWVWERDDGLNPHELLGSIHIWVHILREG